jgi:predicted phosphodiesterase
MKIAVCSDLHLEFGPITLENPGDVDVLILSGDIIVEHDLDEWNEMQADNGFARKRSVMFHTFFQECAEAFPHVIYIAGNHEHYHGDFRYTLSSLKHKLKYLPNVHVLDKESVTIEGVTFLGGTLWTDMNKRDPNTLYAIRNMMNDFRIIKNSDRMVYSNVPVYKYNDDGSVARDEQGKPYQISMKKKEQVSHFSPEDAAEEHEKTLAFITSTIEQNRQGKYVVVGHHSPSHKSCHPRYAADREMNGGYHSDLSEVMFKYPEIVLWTHGHTHYKYDYTIGDCRVVCNPRGYIGYEQLADEFELKVVEI